MTRRVSDTRFLPAKEFVVRLDAYTVQSEVSERTASRDGTEIQRLRNRREGIAEAYRSDRDTLNRSVAACAPIATIFIVGVIE